MLGGVGQQVAVLVNGAALDRQIITPERHKRGLVSPRTIDDHELWGFEATGVEIGEVRVDRGRRCGRVSRPIGPTPLCSHRPFGGKTAPHAVF